MGFCYVVLGSGKQGVAVAYDILRFGDADKVILADKSKTNLSSAESFLKKLFGDPPVQIAPIDILVEEDVRELFAGADAVFSAVPYHFNARLAKLAVEEKAHFCDLGGNTEIVLQELALDQQAKEAGVSVCPDCGLAPGLNNLLAAEGMRILKDPQSVQIYCGGLPRDPKPPLGYHLMFSVEGLLNEYFGHAAVIRDGEVAMVETLTELEELAFPEPLGTLEAFVTSGGTSTAPSTFKGRLQSYDYKTLRYPGHCEKLSLFKELGFLENSLAEYQGETFIPRELFQKVLGWSLSQSEAEDLVILRVDCQGSDGEFVRYELLDICDSETGLTAMERTTAFPAALVLQFQVRGLIAPGAVPIEAAVPTELFFQELESRGLDIKITKS